MTDGDLLDSLIQTEFYREIFVLLLDSTNSWLTIDSVSKSSGISEDKVKKSIQEFEKLNMIQYKNDTEFKLDEDADAVKELLASHKELYNYMTKFSR